MSYSDVECPYCEKGQEIDHDDGYGYEEDRVFNQECADCGKTFTFTTSISYYYEAEKAPCLNGEEHDWEDLKRYGADIFKVWRRCRYCDKEEKEYLKK